MVVFLGGDEPFACGDRDAMRLSGARVRGSAYRVDPTSAIKFLGQFDTKVPIGALVMSEESAGIVARERGGGERRIITVAGDNTNWSQEHVCFVDWTLGLSLPCGAFETLYRHMGAEAPAVAQ